MAQSQRNPLVRRISHPRAEQFFRSLSHRQDGAIDRQIRSLLHNAEQWQLVARLSPADRAHQLRVYHRLVARGHSDEDLLRAALLHDIGKSNGTTRVRLLHRVAHVTGRRINRRFWERICRWRSGPLYLAEYHPSLGAELARATGASARCCDLIARHELEYPTGDQLLDALIQADGEC